MKRYHTNDGEPVSGATSRDVIKALRAVSRDPEPTLQAFMRTTAYRVNTQTGYVVPFHSEAGFVAGLVTAGLLIEETESAQQERSGGGQSS